MNITTTTSSNTSNITWGSGLNIMTARDPGLYSGTYTTTTSNSISSVVEYKIKRCRDCNHAHLSEQSGCIDTVGMMVAFVPCNCKEYKPSDNLEFIEWKYNKEHKESL